MQWSLHGEKIYIYEQLGNRYFYVDFVCLFQKTTTNFDRYHWIFYIPLHRPERLSRLEFLVAVAKIA